MYIETDTYKWIWFQTPTKQSNKTSFSPTLARLLTAPERSVPHATSSPILPNTTSIHASNMSISEILSTNKVSETGNNEINVQFFKSRNFPLKNYGLGLPSREQVIQKIMVEVSPLVLSFMRTPWQSIVYQHHTYHYHDPSVYSNKVFWDGFQMRVYLK